MTQTQRTQDAGGARQKLAMSEMFFEAFQRLPADVRQALQAFLLNFRRRVANEEIEFEPILNAPAYYRAVAIREEDDWTAVLCRPETGSVNLLLWADRREKAFEWAARHICRIHPNTGSLQVYERMDAAPVPAEEAARRLSVAAEPPAQAPAAAETSPEAVSKTASEAAPAAEPAPGPFAKFSENDLLSIGVPQECIAAVQGLAGRDALEAFREKLPVDAFECLVWLGDGESLAAVRAAYAASADDADGASAGSAPTGGDGAPSDAANASGEVPDETEKALATPGGRRGFRLIETDEDMKEILKASLERWRVFLHPSQLRLVYRRESTPTLVRGAAGTGKTVVAMHRAVRLALQPDWRPEDRILFTTFTKNLASDISRQLELLFDQAGAWEARTRVEVINFDAWVASFLKRSKVRRSIVYPGSDAFERCWENAMACADLGLGLPESFYREELRRVVLPAEVTTEAEYLKVPRRGRGTPLSRRERKAVWPVFDEMRCQMSDSGLMTIEDACLMAKHILDGRAGTTEYRAVIVDETQDFGNEALALLARLARPMGDPEAEPRIFLVGDGRQRIYARNGTLSSCGINVRGRRSERLRLTYRTTEEIRRAADAMLAGESFGDMDDGSESASGDLSNRHGPRPVVKRFTDFASESAWVADEVKSVIADRGIEAMDICIVARTNQAVERMGAALESRGVGTVMLSRKSSDDRSVEGVRLATMHRVKGLEFRVVFITGADASAQAAGDAQTEDPVERKAAELTERSLLYVAASRARDALFVTGAGEPAEALGGLKGLSADEE